MHCFSITTHLTGPMASYKPVSIVDQILKQRPEQAQVMHSSVLLHSYVTRSYTDASKELSINQKVAEAVDTRNSETSEAAN